MLFLNFLKCDTAFFSCRIYGIFLFVALLLVHSCPIWSQEIGAYKTILSGDFSNPSIWRVWDGSSWNPTTLKPGGLNDIYIDQNHSIKLVGNEQVKSLMINAETLAGQKLNLNGFNLDVFGMMKAFSGPAPGVSNNAWNSQNWIGNSLQSTITFKGSSRKIVEKSSWSAQTTQSRFSVIFDPGPGVELILEAPLKSLSFRIKSGILIQKLDNTSLPNACFSLSFNTETTTFGGGPFGDFIIESGATFISECNSGILNRSLNGSISALNFILQPGATLILEGNAPKIEAANFNLNGTVIFRGESGPKNFLSSTFPDAAIPNSVRNIELNSIQNLVLPSQLFLSGSLIKKGTGNFLGSGTHLVLNGTGNQEMQGFPLVVRDLTINKTQGTFYPSATVTVERTLILNQGNLDFQGHDLIINTSQSGGMTYIEGSWRNLATLHLHGLPSLLTSENATFPFYDSKNGGIRKIQLLGGCPGGSVSIRFLEYKGADHNPGFSDSDGTPILYQLLSYFQFLGTSSGNQEIELRISAAGLIVDKVDDLRIVKNREAAPGTHLAGLDDTKLWARRKLLWNDLENSTLTVGSYRKLSILPLTWLGIRVSHTKDGNTISWEVAQEKDNLLFEVYRSELTKLAWEKIGSIASKGTNEMSTHYFFTDDQASRFIDYLYRVRQISLDGTETWSSVGKISTEPFDDPETLVIYPNPHRSGTLKIHFREMDLKSKIYILNSQGKVIYEQAQTEEIQEEVLAKLAAGVYIVVVESEKKQVAKRFIRL